MRLALLAMTESSRARTALSVPLVVSVVTPGMAERMAAQLVIVTMPSALVLFSTLVNFTSSFSSNFCVSSVSVLPATVFISAWMALSRSVSLAGMVIVFRSSSLVS